MPKLTYCTNMYEVKSMIIKFFKVAVSWKRQVIDKMAQNQH